MQLDRRQFGLTALAFTDGRKTPQNLAILMNWQKQGGEWKLLSRSATKL